MPYTVRLAISIEPSPNDGEHNFGTIHIGAVVSCEVDTLRQAQDVIDLATELVRSGTPTRIEA